MISDRVLKGLLLGVCSALIACAGVPRDAGFGDVKTMVGARMDHRLHWNKGSQPDQEVARAVDELLATELTPDAAVQIALINNAGLQAVYEDLGVTQADVVEAGLLDNPTIFGQARFPDGSDGAANLEFGIAQNFLNLLMLPARKNLAALQFERKKLLVADAVIQFAADVRKAYFVSVGAVEARELQRGLVAAAENAFELALLMHAAGNLSDLGLAEQQVRYEQARIDLATSEGRYLEDRENLTQMMGLWGERTDWSLMKALPDIPDKGLPLDHLESVAVGNRLDLAGARKEVEAMARALGITVDWRWVGGVEVGISTERDTDRTWVTGPSLSIELPIFNQHQADIARLEAKLRQSHQRLTAQAVQIRSEVRSLRDRLVMQRQLIEHYKKTLLPLKQHIVDLTLRNYNFMLTGAFDLLNAKQNEIETRRLYKAALLGYWVIRTDLQRALGGMAPEMHAVKSTQNDQDGSDMVN